MEYYSALKRNRLSSHKKTWRKLKCLLQREGSKSGKAKYCMIANTWPPIKGKTMETKKITATVEGDKLMNRENTEDF